VADGDGERVGRVIGLREIGEAEQGLHHALDLILGGVSGAADRGLDLLRGIGGAPDGSLSGREDHDAPRLPDASIDPPKPQGRADASVPLVKLAVARSGDKGNHSNIGVIARHPDYLPWIAEALTPQVIVDWMGHLLDPVHGRVERWYLPGSHSLNFLLENALGGGGIASLRIDPQGKAFAQQLLEIPIAVPQHIADQLA